MQSVTVEAKLEINFPSSQAFEMGGGPQILRAACIERLAAEGCDLATASYDDPRSVGDGWAMRATAQKQEQEP